MSGFVTMLKMNLKLLIRNKGYLCFLIILPIVAILTLNIPNDTGYESNGDVSYEVKEINNIDEQLIKTHNTQLSIKVYDSSNSYISDYILNELAGFGSYQVYRYKADNLSEEEAKENALETFNKNNIGAAIYISDNLEKELLKNENTKDIKVYEGADDERISMLKNDLNSLIKNLYTYSALSKGNEEDFKTLIKESESKRLTSEETKINVGDSLSLSAKNKSQESNIGWSMSVLSLMFLFSGVFISSIIIKERQNKVYTRSLLSNMNIFNYGLVKVCLCIITVIIQVIFMGIGIKLFVKSDFGISFASYMIFAFCLGLIFILFSIVVGIVSNSVLTSNYTAFFVWCMTNILSGTYFDIEGVSIWWQRIAYLMPQRWIMKCSEMIMAGKNNVFLILAVMTFSFIIVIICVGAVSFKIRRSE